MNIQQLCIGGVTVRVQWEGNHDDTTARHPLYEPFAVGGSADLTLHVTDANAAPPPATIVLDGFPDWRMRQLADGQLLYEIFDPRAPHPCILWAELADDLTEGRVWMAEPEASLGRIMEPLGQLLLVQLWTRQRAYMVHALAVDDHGVGRVFVGASGTGKSTLARWYQAEGITVLSDERVVLRLTADGRLLAYGTPWPGMAWSGAPGPVPVETLYFLQHAPQHALEPLTSTEAITLLYPQLFLLTRDRAEDVAPVLAWCEQLIARAPVTRLSFAKDPRVLEFVRGAIPQIAGTMVRS